MDLRKVAISKRVIKGSLVWLARDCGKSNCRCMKGKKHVSLYLSRNIKGRTTMTYIPRRYAKAVEEAVKNYKKVLLQLEGISRVNLAAIKRGEHF